MTLHARIDQADLTREARRVLVRWIVGDRIEAPAGRPAAIARDLLARAGIAAQVVEVHNVVTAEIEGAEAAKAETGKGRQQWWQRRVRDPQADRCGADVHQPVTKRLGAFLAACRADNGKPLTLEDGKPRVAFREPMTARQLLFLTRWCKSVEMQRPDAGGVKDARKLARLLAAGGGVYGPGVAADVTDAEIEKIGRRAAAGAEYYHLHVRPVFRRRQARKGRLGAAAANDPARGDRRACVLGGRQRAANLRARLGDRYAEVSRRMMLRAVARTSGAPAEPVAAIAADTGFCVRSCYRADRRNVSRAAAAGARDSFTGAPRSGASGSVAPAAASESSRGSAAAAASPDPAGVAGRQEAPSAAGEAGDRRLLGAADRREEATRREAGRVTQPPASRPRAGPEPPGTPAREPPGVDSGLDRPTGPPAEEPAASGPGEACAQCKGFGSVAAADGRRQPCTCAAGRVFAAEDKAGAERETAKRKRLAVERAELTARLERQGRGDP